MCVVAWAREWGKVGSDMMRKLNWWDCESSLLLKRLDAFGTWFAIHAKRDNVCDVLFALLHTKSFLFWKKNGEHFISFYRRPLSRKMEHRAKHIFISFGITGILWYLWKWSSTHVYARGRKQYCKLHYCLWRVSIKPRLPFSICNVFFVCKGNMYEKVASTKRVFLSIIS